MEENGKCKHETCSCPALPLQDYCGDECMKAVARESEDDAPLERCHCQHPDCGGEPEISDGLFMASEALA